MVGSSSPCSNDPITSVTEAFIADTSPTKINLGVGACRDDEGKPVILQCVREAGAKITACDFLESVSSAVSSKLVAGSVKSVNGKNSDVIKEGRFAGVQALSGTGDCSLFAEFQKHCCPESPMYLPDPTWSKQVCLVSSVISQVLSLKRRLAMREVLLVPYKQPRSSSPN
uniref:Aminotransferase class I/classII large domain-containing protein n=2 Tax=Populus trichocarpa TaxID=3694 RepID=A0A3N7G4C0_POPTR